MSSCFVKDLKCFFCFTKYTIQEVNFSEDLFDLICHNKIDLFWMCDLCKNDPSRMIINLINNYSKSDPKSCVPYREDVFENYKSEIELKTPKCTIPVNYDCSIKHRKQENHMVDKSVESEVRLFRHGSSSPENQKTFSSGSSRSASPPRSSKKDRSALKYAHSILNTIKISPEEEKKNGQIVKQVLEEIILTKLKKNEKSGPLVNRLYYTGSAFNDLRITSATEYDIDLVLKMPKYVTLAPEFIDENYAFVKLNWKLNTNADLESIPVKFLNDNSVKNSLHPEKVLSWLQRHIDLILQQDLELPFDVCQIKNSASGPARTIIIEMKSGYSISVDLVPVFEFDYSVLSDTPFYHKVMEARSEDENSNKFLTIPKQCKDEDNILVADSKLCWRLDFPRAERSILVGKQCAKPVIKILKIFRDNRDWKDLASYYLKMVVILEIDQNPLQEHWENGNLFQRLLDCFKHLKDYFKSEHLPHFLTQRNLLSKFNSAQCVGWSNHLKHLITLLESNPEHLVQILNSDETDCVPVSHKSGL